MKNVRGGAKNWNQYSNCMHVSIFLCYRVSVLKSLNYACKNLTYAYICMKVYSLAGQRETSITVSKRQTEVVRFGLLQGWSPGSFWQLLGATCTDPRPVKATSSALCFRLHFLLCVVQPFVSLQAHSSELCPRLPMVLKSILPCRAYFFLSVAVTAGRMLLTPSGDRLGMLMDFNRAGGRPPPQ